jgi:hypothetical protein
VTKVPETKPPVQITIPRHVFALACAAVVWLLGILLLRVIPADGVGAKVVIGTLIAIASSVVLYLFGIKDDLTLASMTLFGGVLVIAISIFFS